MLPILAMAGSSSGGQSTDLFASLMPVVLIMLLFYMLLIRPQQKKQRLHEELLKAIKKGDQVVTSGGIHGIVVGLTDDTVLLKVADNVKVTFSRNVIARVKDAEAK